ncbi:MAG TPA: cell division protein FtsQ/DivIB [Burkholderiales bacterium]|nr:cell division protein FtsQ/DivIB [Burkholderiales bacterium]
MNAAATALAAFAALALFYAAGMHVLRHPAFALREVRVVNELRHVSREEVVEVARRELRGGFFTLDLEAARAAFERLPWVRRASVWRRWPDRLEVALEEHVPLARWSATALVNTHGELFEGSYAGSLPLFRGPDGGAREIAIQYRYFRRSLEPIGRVPVEVALSPRRAWRLVLDGGLALELGREEVEARLARFVAAYARTVGRLERSIEYVDLRYPNGFAVRVPGLRDGEIGPGRAGPRNRRTG